MTTSTTVVALAGRRIDAPNTDPKRFPLGAVMRVSRGIETLLREEQSIALVASAACGADLIGLQNARALGLRTRIVLPFEAQSFRESSVVDRPGDWGDRFDAVIADARKRNDVVELAASST